MDEPAFVSDARRAADSGSEREFLGALLLCCHKLKGQQAADPTGSKVVDKFDAKMSKYDPTGGMVHDGATAYKDIAADLFG